MMGPAKVERCEVRGCSGVTVGVSHVDPLGDAWVCAEHAGVDLVSADDLATAGMHEANGFELLARVRRLSGEQRAEALAYLLGALETLGHDDLFVSALDLAEGVR